MNTKHLLFYILTSFCLINCGKIEEKKKEISTSILEKAVESAGMPEVDMADVKNIDKNKVTIDLDLSQIKPLPNFDKAVGNVTASYETIAITLTSSDDTRQDALIIGITGSDLRKSKPLKGSVKSEDDVKFTLGLNYFGDNSFSGVTAVEGSIEVTELSDKRTVILLDVKVAEPLNIEKPENWIPLKGKILMDYPMFTVLGGNKEELSY